MQYKSSCFRSLELAQGTLKYLSAASITSSDTSTITVTLSSDPSISGSQFSITSVLTRDQWVRTDEQIISYIMRSIFIPIRLLLTVRLPIDRSISSREQWLGSKPYVCPGQCCSGVSVVSSSSRCQAGRSLHSRLLLAAFRFLGGTA